MAAATPLLRRFPVREEAPLSSEDFSSCDGGNCSSGMDGLLCSSATVMFSSRPSASVVTAWTSWQQHFSLLFRQV
nr:hypothetical protein Itr_chr15CG11640 [Ipomoea trifida]GMD41960.1 hypothetical protein Iba_chr10bCG4730 [Ipomoea batatas]GMD95396.1 hypothetical protein Iba_chr15aCG11900 [Ipomoea batatas]GMD98943.1 hypothetical protein Iba_chr15dCG7630 [Ipomoea batatas]